MRSSLKKSSFRTCLFSLFLLMTVPTSSSIIFFWSNDEWFFFFCEITTCCSYFSHAHDEIDHYEGNCDQVWWCQDDWVWQGSNVQKVQVCVSCSFSQICTICTCTSSRLKLIHWPSRLWIQVIILSSIVVEQQYRYKSLCWRRPRMSESESPDFF